MTTTSMSKEEYLKKYYLNSADLKRKSTKEIKRKKKTIKEKEKESDEDQKFKKKQPLLRVFDDDVEVDWVGSKGRGVALKGAEQRTDRPEVEDEEEDEVGDDAPTIVGSVIDERPPEVIRAEQIAQGKWKAFTSSTSGGGLETEAQNSEEDEEEERGVRGEERGYGGRMRHDSSSSSASSVGGGGSNKADMRWKKTPPGSGKGNRKDGKKNDADSDDQSPPRKTRHDSDSDDQSPGRRKKKGGSDDSDDQSPPRKKRHASGSDDDQSPPRKRRNDSGSDQSPPRRRKKGGSDSDPSPPRKRRNASDSDDQSPPRRKTNSRHPEGVEDENRDRKKRKESRLDDKQSGLQNLEALRRENEAAKQKARKHMEKLGKLSKNEATIVRDRKTGRKIDLAEERRKKAEEEERKAKREAKYAEWGMGLKQKEMQRSLVEDAAFEMSKPFARYEGDEDLERMLKEQEREGDPMKDLLRARKTGKNNGDTSAAKDLPKYKGPPPPPNRFGIAPGYRWDGVDRSNGFEKSRVQRMSNKIANEEEAYKWSVEDM